jgi:hypothetical protein
MRKRSVLTIKTSGSAGTSTGSGIVVDKIDGWVIGIYMDVPGGAPATLDMVVTEATQQAKQAVLTKNNFNADSWFYPRNPAHAVADGAVIAGQSLPVIVDDTLLISLTGADDNQYYTITVLWDDFK